MIPFIAPFAGLLVTLLASLSMYRLGIRVGRARGVQEGTQLARAHELRLEEAIERDAWLRAYCAALAGNAPLSDAIVLCAWHADQALIAARTRRTEAGHMARIRRLAGD